MPVLNSDIASSLDKLADLLELRREPFRIHAYRNAARVVGELPRSNHSDDRCWRRLRGAARYRKGPRRDRDAGDHRPNGCSRRDRTADSCWTASPAGCHGLGPKRALLLNERLGIRSLGELPAAAKARQIRELPGFGAKTEKRLLQKAEKRAALRRGADEDRESEATAAEVLDAFTWATAEDEIGTEIKHLPATSCPGMRHPQAHGIGARRALLGAGPV
jgi:DNA polymerase (family X)